MENSFICLLPSEKDAALLHQTFDAIFSIPVFPRIKLPLHLTLCFFPKIDNENTASVMSWMQNKDTTISGPILASTNHVQCFKKGSSDFVYYLPVSSEKIIRLHDDLTHAFNNVSSDPFNFIPHLSLFYPDRNLSNEEKDAVQIVYKNIESLSFDRLAFAKENNSGTHFINVQKL